MEKARSGATQLPVLAVWAVTGWGDHEFCWRPAMLLDEAAFVKRVAPLLHTQH